MPSLSRILHVLLLTAAAETALVVGHFAYGARIYDDPTRYHVVMPAIVALLVATSLGVYLRCKPSRSLLRFFAVAVAVPFIGVFGLYHGAFGHGLKLVLFEAGVPLERLLAIFDSPDFAVPNDAIFELSGLGSFLVSLVVGGLLAKLLSASRHGRELRPTKES